MENQATVKEIVKQKYGAIAEQSKTSQNKCGCGCQSTNKIVDYSIVSDDYSGIDG